ncbi:MAG: hypothetical protein ACREBZ_01650, partial [Thermoplasmata archaeon]
LAFENGVSLVQLKALYGHESLDQTTEYIGADLASLQSGLRKLELAVESEDDVPNAPEVA